MRTDTVRMIAHDLDQFAGDFGCFDARQPDAKLALNLKQGPDELRETRPLVFGSARVPIDAVMTQVNSGKYDFTDTAVDDRTNFVHDIAKRPTVHLRPNLGDDAITATEQAAVLYFDEGARPVMQAVHAARDVDHAMATEPIGQFALVKDYFGNAGQSADFVGCARCITAHDHDMGVRVLVMQSSNGLTAFGIAFLRHGAGVDQADIRRFTVVGVTEADSVKPFSDELRFVLIDFAAQSQRFEHTGHNYTSGSIVADIDPLQRSINSSLPKEWI